MRQKHNSWLEFPRASKNQIGEFQNKLKLVWIFFTLISTITTASPNSDDSRVPPPHRVITVRPIRRVGARETTSGVLKHPSSTLNYPALSINTRYLITLCYLCFTHTVQRSFAGSKPRGGGIAPWLGPTKEPGPKPVEKKIYFTS